MNCLRCGSEVSGSSSFCPDCAALVSQPLEDSPYLNTQITLPTRVPQPAKKQESKKISFKYSVKKFFLRFTMTLLSLALLLYSGYSLIYQYRTRQELSRLRETEQAYLQQSDTLSRAQTSLQDLAQQVESLNESIALLQQELAQAQADNVDLQAKLAFAEGERDTLTAELTALVEKTSFLDSTFCFVLDDGYYHSYDCDSFTAERFRPYSISQAEAIGYDPCPLCCEAP